MTFSRRRSALEVSTLLVILVLGSPSAARAQRTAEDIASARQLYNEGIELRDKGDMKGALEKFKAAHALGNTPITGVELCRTYAALEQPIEARETCLGVGRIAPLPEESQRSTDARHDAARLAEAERVRIGSIRLRITGVPAGWQPTVTVDGHAIPPAALHEPRAVNPGIHTIVAKLGGGPETLAMLETRAGEARDLELAVQPPPVGEEPADAVPVPSPSPPPSKNTFATASFVIAGTAAFAGTIAGLVAMSGEGDLDKACQSKICGRDQWDALDSAETWGNVSTASFVVAGVALGAGLVSTLTSRSSKPARAAGAPGPVPKVTVTPVLGLGAAGVHGSF